MNTFIAYSVIQHPVEFSIDDCPHLSSDGIVTLVNREKSPLIDAKTIMRVFPTFTEGDYVEVDGSEGIIYYDKAVMLKTKDEIKKVKEIEHIKVIDRRIETVMEAYSMTRTSILFVYKNSLYGFKDFICRVGSYLCVVGSRRKVPVKDLLPFTGITFENKPLGFGSSFKGGIIVLHNGEPHIQYNHNNLKLLKEELQ